MTDNAETERAQTETLDSTKIKIFTVLTTADSDPVNVTYAIFKIIAACDRDIQPELFEFYCETYGTTNSSDEQPVVKKISDDKLELLTIHYQDVVDGMMVSLFKRNLIEKEFYKKLWEFVCEADIFESTMDYNDDEARAYALLNVVVDKRIPYFRLSNGLKMSNEDYSSAQDKLISSIQKLKYILATDFSQKTEQASHIVDLLDDYNDSRIFRTVLMSHVISDFEKKEQRLVASLQKRGIIIR